MMIYTWQHTPQRQGQASLEAVAAVVGIVAFVAATAYLWGWFQQIFVGREQAYQQTRVTAASLDGNIGVQNQYEQPILNVFGPSEGTLPPSGIIATATCPAGQELLAEAEALHEEADALDEQINTIQASTEAKQTTYQEQLEVVDVAWQYYEEWKNDPPTCSPSPACILEVQAWAEELGRRKRDAEVESDRAQAYYDANLAGPYAQMQQLRDEASRLQDEAKELIVAAREECAVEEIG